VKDLVFATPVVTLVLSSLFMTGCSSAATTAPPAKVASTLTNTGTLLRQSTLYPRAIRLAHGPAVTNGQVVASTNGVIFRSLDNGTNFNIVGQVPTASGSTERCCATLYELPKSVGTLAAGTLLSAASYLLGTVPSIEVYISTDAGTTWSYSSTPATRGGTNHGLWEPEFEVAADGALVIFWSDETDSCCSQKLAQARSYNGTTWQDETNTVASAVQPDRPGMVTVSKLPDGHFFMSYELCGPAACTVFYRTSIDGWNFGTPSDLGTKVVSTTGQYFEHAPVNVWTTSSGSTNGKLLIVGQVLYESNGAISSHNGQLIFVNSAVDGSGPWSTLTAPVLVPTAYDNYCPNYSSALLPSIDGSTLLELASYYNSGGVCMTYYGTGPLQ
jgi:hypothetical protein